MLAGELAELGADGIKPAEGGVGFSGGMAVAYAANLHSRIASRVLWEVGSGRYRSEDDVYRGVNALDWPQWFDGALTIRVNVAAVRSPLNSLDFITLRIKDAVCDRFRTQTGLRPKWIPRNRMCASMPSWKRNVSHCIWIHLANRCSNAARGK